MIPKWHAVTLTAAVAFCGFSAAHLIDEFVWGAPAEFHLSIEAAEVLALAYMLALAGLTVAAARGSRPGLRGLAISGALLALADVLKHAPASWSLAPGAPASPPEPWPSASPSQPSSQPQLRSLRSG